MTLSDISIRNPVFAWMLMIGLIFFGAIGFQRMGVSQMPDVDFPVVSVSMDLEGAAPEVVETEIVDVLEDAVLTIEGVRSVTSSAQQGSGSVSVEFELDRNIDVALQEVQTKISQARRLLPDQADPPVVRKSNPEDMPILWVGLSGTGKTTRELIDYADDHLKHKLQTVAGVGEVQFGGFLERNLRVWVDGRKLSSREMTVTDLLDTIEQQHKETPAGRIETSAKEFNVRVMGEATGIAAFENLRITTSGGRPLHRSFRLGDVARVEDDLADVRRLARVNGNPAIGLGVKKQRGSNAVAVAHGIKERMGGIL